MIKHKTVTSLPAADLFSVDQWAGDFFITRDRTLCGAFEISGIDPAALGFNDHLKLAQVIDRIFTSVPDSITVTQYQINSKAEPIVLRERGDPVQNQISKSREAFLATRDFLETRLVHFFEISLDDSFNSLSPLSILGNLAGSLYDKNKRAALKNSLSAKQQLLISRKDLNEKIETLRTAIDNSSLRWQSLCETRSLGRKELQMVLRFLASFRSETLLIDRDALTPVGQFIADGDIKPVNLSGQSCIRFDGPEPVYARMAAITGFGARPMPGAWALGDNALSQINAPVVLMYRWKKLSNLQTSLLFEMKRKELERQTLNFQSMIASKHQGNISHLSQKLQNKFKELDEADAMRVHWYKSEAYILTYGSDASEIKRRTKLLHNAFVSSGATLVWEDSNLMNAYRAFYPTGAGKGARKLTTNNAQNAAWSLSFKSSIGMPRTEHTGEEALCVFQSPAGNPFHYYPQIGGKGLVLGFGPTRTGKTYFKNTVALHSLKYGGLYFALDVDPGTEPLANVLGENGSVFRVYDERHPESGFNLFATATGVNDQEFKTHFMQQIRRMINTNYDEDSRSITIEEQGELDAALIATLQLPEDMQSLSYFYSHLSKELAAKLSRWVMGDVALQRPDGLYGVLTDSRVDAIKKTTRFNVYNFQRLKNDNDQRAVAYAEVFYRILRKFESPELRSVPKFLDVDECHIPLQDIEFQNWITQGIVTWNKFNVLPSLWTQSIEEMLKLERWEAIRSAAATLLFTADHELNDTLYMQALGLSAGECQAIKTLIPRRQIYIIQRDIGVSKILDINNDPMTDLIVTSQPDTVVLRDQMIDMHGLNEGLTLTLEELKKRRQAAQH